MTHSDAHYQLYDYHTSGNGYKVALILHHLGKAYVYHETDILAGRTHTPDFLKLNPNGKIPVLVTPDGKVLSESNAILTYLAEGTPYLPQDSFERYQVMRWLFWEQYSHEPNIATSRFWLHHPDADQFKEKLTEKRPGCLAALKQMEEHLTQQAFMAGDTYTIADMALFAYTHVAHEGGYPLDDYPAIRAWIQRVENQEGFLPLAQKSDTQQNSTI